jgi:hypothetical protein
LTSKHIKYLRLTIWNLCNILHQPIFIYMYLFKAAFIERKENVDLTVSLSSYRLLCKYLSFTVHSLSRYRFLFRSYTEYFVLFVYMYLELPRLRFTDQKYISKSVFHKKKSQYLFFTLM